MIRVTHYRVVAAKPRVSHLSLLFSFTLYGKTMRRIENRLTPLVTVAVILNIMYLLLLVVLFLIVDDSKYCIDQHVQSI